MPHAAVFCVAVMYSSVRLTSESVMLDSIYVVCACMVEMSSDGRERSCMMFLWSFRVVGSVSWPWIGLASA